MAANYEKSNKNEIHNDFWIIILCFLFTQKAISQNASIDFIAQYVCRGKKFPAVTSPITSA